MNRIIEKSIKKNNYDLYFKIINYSININLTSFTQKYYNYINNIDVIPKCPECGKECNFTGRIISGYYEFCSTKCARNSRYVKNKIVNTNQKKYGTKHPVQSKIVKDKIKKTNLERYGVESVSQLDSIKAKVKKTNLERYGVEHLMQLNVTKEKLKKTTNKKYGVDYATQSEEIKNKIKKTNLERYGVESHNQSEEIKEKKIKTNLERYGVKNPFQSEKIKEKIKNKKQKKYNDEYYNNPIKRKQTLIERYGIDHPTKLKKFSEKAINTMIERYGEIWIKHIPTYNPNSIIYLDMIAEKLNLHIQHALNGGEKKFVRYWVDGYIEEYNICLEWDEKKHQNSKKLKQRDNIREKYIVDNFNCYFIRINEDDFMKNVDEQMNIIILKIMNIIEDKQIIKAINILNIRLQL